MSCDISINDLGITNVSLSEVCEYMQNSVVRRLCNSGAICSELFI